MSSPLKHKLGLDLSCMYSKRRDRKEREPRSAVILDVGGERFTASRDIIQNFPGTRYNKGNMAMTMPPIGLYQAGQTDEGRHC